jgi:hypothetical protein
MRSSVVLLIDVDVPEHRPEMVDSIGEDAG